MEPIKVKPSQLPNMYWIALSSLTCILFLPLGILMLVMGVYYIIEASMHSYTFYEEYVEESKGVFTMTKRRINYFRIKSVVVEEPILQHIVGLGNVIVTSSEPGYYTMKMKYVTIPNQIYELLTCGAKETRKNMGIKEYDIHQN